MSIVGTFPTVIANGQDEDATVVMSLFSFIQSQTNANACPCTTGSAIQKADGSGGLVPAVAGIDYAAVGTSAGDARYPLYVGAAAGTSDALTATITPCGISALYDGLLVSVEASAANASTTPTFNLTLDITATGAQVIKKFNLASLTAGDIRGLGHRLELSWSVVHSCWLLLNPYESAAQVAFSDGRYPMYAGAAGGSADAITATINPCGISALYDGQVITLVAGSANATTTPVLNLTLGITATGAQVIKKWNLQPLAAGDISGAGHRLELSYNLAGTCWMLLNPASGSLPGSLSANGYQVLPSGLILQWGTNTPAATTRSFPIAFPTACVSLTATCILDANLGAAVTEGQMLVYIVSSSQFRIRAGTSNLYTYYWFAIGY